MCVCVCVCVRACVRACCRSNHLLLLGQVIQFLSLARSCDPSCIYNLTGLICWGPFIWDTLCISVLETEELWFSGSYTRG